MNRAVAILLLVSFAAVLFFVADPPADPSNRKRSHITVLGTWPIPYVSAITDLFHIGSALVLQGNTDGTLFLADPFSLACLGEIPLPSGALGPGVAFDAWYTGLYFINHHDTAPLILHSDGTGTLERFPFPGGPVWTARLIARELGDVSTDHVWRVFREHGIHLQRRRSWCVSADPQFAGKAVDIVGLCLAQRGREAFHSGA